MKIKIHEHDCFIEVLVDGNILQENVDIFRNRLNDLIDNGSTLIVVNLSATSYLSSLCLSVLINVKNRLDSMNGDLKIASANKLIRNLLEITNLLKKIETFDTVELAAVAFKK